MTKETAKNKEVMSKEPYDDDSNIPHYDPHITPAETAARLEREGGEFMHTPHKEDDQNQELGGKATADDDTIDTTAGYRVDKEGLLDNFAVEPEMYINEPGDLREKEAQLDAERRAEVANLAQDEQGNLTMEEDKRPKGQGIV